MQEKDSTFFKYYTVLYLALFWVENYGKNEKKIIKSVKFTKF